MAAEPERFGDIRRAVPEWRGMTIGPKGEEPSERPFRMERRAA